MEDKLLILNIIICFVCVILFFLGIMLSYKGGKSFYHTGSFWKIIIGFILINFLGLLISFLSYKSAKIKKRKNKTIKN